MSNKLHNQIDLVIFDCDGVILDSEIISADMLIRELERYRVQIDHRFVARHFLGRSYPVVFSEIKDIFGIELPPEFETHYRTALLEEFARSLQPISGVGKVANALNVPFCVATSSSRDRVLKSLEIVGLSDIFSKNLFTSDQVEHGKPAPDLLLFAAKKMGFLPKNCLVVEDSLNGVRAGIAAKMKVLRFIGGSHIEHPLDPEPEGAQPHAHIKMFEQFFDICPDLEMLGD